MGKNWIHLQDGTRREDAYDLTLTTADDANVGDVVVFTGKIALNKDYKYDIIMEDATRQTE